MKIEIKINDRFIGDCRPVYIIAELSANHNHNFDKAVRLIKAAKKAGADAVKLQTYTPDTMTIDCDNEYFKIKGTKWAGKNLYELYKEAHTPWDWQPKLKKIADEIGIDLFSTPFDATSVDFLEKINVPAYKVASFELIDIPLLKKIARTGKPIIMSTGMASLGEIDEAVDTIRSNGNNQLALLKCTSAYPALPEEANLKTIPHMAEIFKLPVGLSDHTLGSAVSIAGVTLGACIIEKHFTLSREDGSPDSAFSMEPHEFTRMVEDIRITEKSVGHVTYALTDKEKESVCFRRSLFAVKNMNAGDIFTEENIKSIRPGYGLHTRYFELIIGKKSKVDIRKGTPLGWSYIL